MNEVFDASVLARRLPGTWSVVATNFPMWLDGTRHDPEFTYDTVAGEELTLSDTVSYTTKAGEPKTIVGTDRLRGDEFVWRGQGWLKVLTSRWHVVGANDTFSIIVIRFARSRLTPAGIDVLVRKDATEPAVRSTVAHATEQFGITAEDLASLTWL
ncbi:hypothetical protein [Salinibacterium sp. M195]|uniref:hypothetical protein n=1 Tax=Salinibacterium sp. M195 TaxID=2583374 RepID=UPI002105053A|nr:hypothetical protein [Salinibacterium sp. M195]